jgi:hypothetical protein
MNRAALSFFGALSRSVNMNNMGGEKKEEETVIDAVIMSAVIMTQQAA